jgi:hypothetical protein
MFKHIVRNNSFNVPLICVKPGWKYGGERMAYKMGGLLWNISLAWPQK